MSDPNRRLEAAARARDEAVMLAWLEVSPPARCPACDRPLTTVLPGSGKRGRTRVWCSDACRQRGYRARKSGALPTKETVTTNAAATNPPPPAGHSLDQCIVKVLETPTAVASVIDVVRRALIDGALDKREYSEVQAALVALREAIRPDLR